MMATSWLCGILSGRHDAPVRAELRTERNTILSWAEHRCFFRLRLFACLLICFVALSPTLVATAQVTVPSAASVAPAAKGSVAPVQAGPAPAADATAQGAEAGKPWKLVRLIKLPNPGAASLDRRGALYVADADNNLRQYSPEGLPLNTYAPAQPGHVAQVEAWNVTSTLVFNDDRQQLILLDRFLAAITEIRLADFLDGTIRAATLAPDNRIWLLDESNLVLREFDLATQRLIQNTPLDLIIGRSRPDFRFLRQYQNNTYLVDRTTGVYVFDNLGNYSKKLPFVGLNAVGFRGDELYYFDAAGLHFFHLYSLTERRVALPAGVAASEVRQVLVGESYAYIFTRLGITVYQLQ